jgi:hypothetical protein
MFVVHYTNGESTQSDLLRKRRTRVKKNNHTVYRPEDM